MTEAIVAVLATGVLFAVLRQLAVLEQRVKKLEADSHPPVDVRPAMRMVARAEVKRFLEEHVP